MRALVCRALTGIESLQVDASWPTPTLAAGQVLVEVTAAGLNYPDLLMLTGSYQHKAEPPFVPGMEGAGRITAVASGVDPACLGQQVMFSARGAFATLVAVDMADIADVPADWSLEQAAAFPVVAKTAFHALVHRARLQPGEWLAVHGASGGTGHMAVKLGKALGARVVATSGDTTKFAHLLELGAEAVVDATAIDLVEQLKAATGGHGVDVVFDPVGGAVFDASLKAAAFGGRILVIGFTASQPNAVRTNYALIKGLSVLGVRAGEAARHNPTIRQSYRDDIPALLARSDLKPRVSERFNLEQGAEAFRRMQARRFVGKLVITL
jgi:NADPH:quinone reductase